MRPKIELGDRNGLTEIKEEPSLNAADTQRIYDGLLASDPADPHRAYRADANSISLPISASYGMPSAAAARANSPDSSR